MNWILGYLNENDYVTYQTNLSTTVEQCTYEEFINLTYPYINDHKLFLEHLNRHLTIYIDILNNSWDIHRQQFEEPSFDELYELNSKDKKVDNISLFKKYIIGISDKKNDRQDVNRKQKGVTIRSFFNRNK